MTQQLKNKTYAISILLLSAISIPAQAGEIDYTLGAGAIYSPDYTGSDDYEVNAAPILSAKWNGNKDTQDGFSAGLFSAEASTLNGIQLETLRYQIQNHRISGSIGVTPEFGRDSDDNTALRGMGDIDLHASGNLTLSYGPASPQSANFITAEASLARDLTGETDSTLLSAEIKANHAIGEKLVISHGPHITWANEDHMQSYFGVTSRQAARSGHAEYAAESGLHDAGYSATAMYSVTKNISLIGSVDYSNLGSEAADSPLVDRNGDDQQFQILSGIAYNF